jgi:HPt (histidine-containing phosphotransfer) domain-containing protein
MSDPDHSSRAGSAALTGGGCDGSLRPIVNLKPALDRLGGDWELLQDLARIFLEDVPGLVQRLQQGLRQQNAHEVEASAHSIKGMSVNFNAIRLEEAAQRIESAGRSRDLSGLGDPLPELEERVAELCRELNDQVLAYPTGPAED